MTNEEKHPYNTLETIPEGTRSLIVGTAPPLRFAQKDKLKDGDVDFFYGSKDNQLWSKIIPELYKRSFCLSSPDESRKIMREFLTKHEMWMVDVLQSYRRNNDDAADKNLCPLTYTDFRLIFKKHPTVNALIFTGGFAEKWTGEQMEGKKLIPSGQFQKGEKALMPRHRRLKIELDGTSREIDAFTLPSPSNANNKVYAVNKKIEMYGSVLLKFSK